MIFMEFPKNFLWGAASAAGQTEGHPLELGGGLSVWDAFCARPGSIQNGETDEVCTDFLQQLDLQSITSCRHDIRRTDFLQLQRREHIRLHILANGYDDNIEVQDAQLTQRIFIRCIRLHNMREFIAEFLYPFHIFINGQNLIAHLCQSLRHVAAKTAQSDNGELTHIPFVFHVRIPSHI